ncbi:molecular chaperone DnaJ [Candidatus Xianfuyuplasma coldseepsis]|uniref:Chaperone protein DnaJ n=1 Tax=Candidatus Xianfuyuplasma coldseepsis TaxID=2782163 RepID=A0A7L7KUJ9_9MOLU|nr:molecular chaperone DnaJ [Xianfuyuplasma coldseepsis]QMS85916.1 molecular chaperone DnaJ [Xianfuyuplasma coldseepsis]
MSEKRDYYDVLGIDKNADDAAIKRAYRTLAKKYHPDVSTEDNAEAKFKEVQEAYEVLSDSQKRAQYDRFGHQANNGAGFNTSGFGGFDFDINDIFSSFFGGGGGTSRGGNRRRKGQDIQRRMSISFEEAVFGAKKKLRVTVHEECHTCHGTGAHSKNDVKTCSRCNGRGSVIVEQQSIFGRTRTQTTCPECNGTGKEITKPCATCHGEGIETHNKDIEVSIPAGIDTGQQIRLEGYGNKGVNGGPSGDLYILFDVKPHELFERHGDDIVIKVPITISQAALGDTIKVPTPHGNVKLKIPAGTQSETTFRLRGKGIPNVRTKRNGDEHVLINVVTPTKLNRKQTQLFEQLSKTDLTNDSLFDKFKRFIKN